MPAYVVLIKSARLVQNVDGSVRYRPGDLLPVGHPDIETHLGDAALPIAFEVVKDGLRDTSERGLVFVGNGEKLGPRALYGERPTGLYGTVSDAYKPVKKDPEPKPEPKKAPEPEPEPPKKESAVPAAAATPEHKPATLNDGGSAAEAGPSSSAKGRHS